MCVCVCVCMCRAGADPGGALNFITHSACAADPGPGLDLMHDYMYNYTYSTCVYTVRRFL